MDRLHLHAREIEEDARRQHHVVEIAEVGDQAGVQVEVHRLARRDIGDAERDQDRAGDDRPEQTAEPAQPGRCRHAAEGDQRHEPIDREQDGDRVEFVVGQRLVERGRPPDIGERGGGEDQHGREPDHHRLPLIIDRGKAPARAERLADPAEHAALLGEGRGEFGSDQRHRYQEHDRGEQIIEDRRHAVFGLGGHAAQADDRRHVHDRERQHADHDLGLRLGLAAMREPPRGLGRAAGHSGGGRGLGHGNSLEKARRRRLPAPQTSDQVFSA